MMAKKLHFAVAIVVAMLASPCYAFNAHQVAAAMLIKQPKRVVMVSNEQPKDDYSVVVNEYARSPYVAKR